jgi:hypothetical protein
MAMAEKRYIVGGSDGWLRVKREPSGEIVALPEFVRVEFTNSTGGRDYFSVIEGPEKSKKFSVLTGNLRPGEPGYRAGAALKFSLGQKILTYSGGRAAAFTHPSNPISVGTHPIQIPDFPHDLGNHYMGTTSYARSWFYLGHGAALPGNNDRYLHPGLQSAGCITVEPKDWTAFYKYLILCRGGNGTTVGAVTVTA